MHFSAVASDAKHKKAITYAYIDIAKHVGKCCLDLHATDDMDKCTVVTMVVIVTVFHF